MATRAYFLIHRAPPDNATNARLIAEVATRLAEEGTEVTIFASKPAPALNSQLRRLRNGVKMKYFRNPRLNYDRITRRLLNSFCVDVQVLVKLLFSRRADVLVADTTSPFLGVVAWLVSKLRRMDYVYLSTELYPEVVINLGVLAKNGLIARIWRFANRRVVRGARAVVAINPTEKGLLASYLADGDTTNKLHVIHNWADPERIRPIAPRENPFRVQHGLVDTLTLVYSGKIGRSHDMRTILDAAAQLKGFTKAKFVVIGAGAGWNAVAERVESQQLDNVLLLPLQPPEMLPYSLSSGDFTLLSLVEGVTTTPSRVYPAMAAGQAVMCVASAHSGLGTLVEEEAVGLRFDNGDAAGLASAVRRYAAMPSRADEFKRRARKAVEARYSGAVCVSQYIQLLRSTMSPRAGSL